MRIALSVCRIVFGLLFVVASVDKIMHPAAFVDIVGNYRLLPDGIIVPFALILPWLELVAGVALIVGKAKEGAYVILLALTVGFLAALISTLIRGIDINCGCFSTSGTGASLYWDIGRDLVILIIGLAAGKDVFQQNPRLGRRLQAL
ncbi:MauE/DoxX family redox-associated membrane protein [Desulfovibrio inopinatus]|uniref:MauE/DoxX family redox-associated membrane protein n=1 Tax=Desulfovibrio inopinatus TaxID=102109 RepID=UPI00040E9165|nr:MauE/DoxX family redox-associated membrane protein [Desulfovibrio inopinatus]